MPGDQVQLGELGRSPSRSRRLVCDEKQAEGPGAPKTNLADILEDHHDKAEVANMEGRQRKPDMAEVAGAVLQGFMASTTIGRPARRSQPRVKGAMAVGDTPVFDVIE